MNTRRLILTAFATAHVALMIASAFRVRHFGSARLDQAVGTYAFVTGSGDSFGFFCAVPNQLRPKFVITYRDGTVHTDALWRGPMNHEAELRYQGSVSFFGNLDDALRADLLRSWSATMFGRHPDAARVEIHLDAYVVPGLSELQRGVRPEWTEIYSATFEKSDSNPSRRTTEKT